MDVGSITSRLSRKVARASLLLVVLSLSSPASAQTSAAKGSEPEAVFDAARALVANGRYAEACPMFEKVRAVSVGIGVTFNLADCYERIGRTASAWTGFQDAAAAADAAGQPERAQVARERASALVAKLSLLRIVVPAEAASTPNLDVQREGISISRLLWGKSVPVDPGEYVVSAAAPGRKAWSRAVVVRNSGEVVAVEIPALEPTGAATSEGPSPQGGRFHRLGTAVVLGGAIVSLVALEVGIGFTVAANGQGANVRAIRETLGGPSACYGPPDPNTARSCAALREAGAAWDTFENAAIANYVVSGLAAAGAILTYIAWPEPPRPRKTLVLPSMTTRGAGLVVTGTF